MRKALAVACTLAMAALAALSLGSETLTLLKWIVFTAVIALTIGGPMILVIVLINRAWPSPEFLIALILIMVTIVSDLVIVVSYGIPKLDLFGRWLGIIGVVR